MSLQLLEKTTLELGQTHLVAANERPGDSADVPRLLPQLSTRSRLHHSRTTAQSGLACLPGRGKLPSNSNRDL
jgi:hypothetical protein